MTTEHPTQPRRAGGRRARRSARAAPLDQTRRPVRAGLTGGQYRPLTDAQMQEIHQTALHALETIGLADAPESGIRAMRAIGAQLGDDGRLRFPRAVVEAALEAAARNITLHARDPAHDLHLAPACVHYGTAGAAVYMVDARGRAYRESTVRDLHDAARIADQLDNIHFFQRPMICRDIADNRAMDLNTIYASCTGTLKHVGTSFSDPAFVADGLALLHLIAGGEDPWRTRPFASASICFVVPPMKFSTEACETLEACIRGGMPVLLLSAGQSGATAPAPLAGAVMQAVAECLAGLVYVQAIAPGHPAIFGTWPFVSDLRTGAMSGGSGEQALLTAACAQMARFYGLPGAAAAGIADAKLPDMQAGWEAMCSNLLAGLAGLNMIYEAAGMHGSLMGFSPESLILGNDLIGQALRCVRGIEVTPDTLALEAMREVCLTGPGHYLGTEQTLRLMQSEYLYPDLADRTTPKEWEEQEKPNLTAQAEKRKNDILSRSSRAILDQKTDAEIRARFPIHLPA